MNWLSIFQATILGIVEGITEFLPVSSTGHLIVFQDLLGFTGKKENAFVIFIQLGAILAVLWLYRQKCYWLALNWRKDPGARRLLLNLLVATLPAVAIGLPAHDWVEAHLFQPKPVAIALIVGGVAIFLVERLCRRPSTQRMEDISTGKALGVGLVQVLSILFPGVSRSGATIMGGLTLGLSRTAATEFSFFLAIPAIVGATAVKMISVRHLITLSDLPTFSVGFVVSFLAALVAIRGLLSFVSRNSFIPFAWYRVLAGLALLVFYWHAVNPW